jgi:AraC-like DNA-binding protein/ligand-binding sensor protein
MGTNMLLIALTNEFCSERSIAETMKSTVYQLLMESRSFHDMKRAFCDATSLTLILERSDASRWRRTSGQQHNTFCTLIGNNGSPCTGCLELQQEFERRLGRKLAPQQARCFAGLSELAVPIVVGGKHAATLVGGQVFQEKPKRREFDRLCSKLCEWGMQPELQRIEEAYFAVPVVPAKQFQGAAGLLLILANHLAELANRLLLNNRQEAPLCVTRAKEYALAHVSEGVALQQAAEYVHLSRHYFCRIFKDATGMTFMQFVARARVQKAKDLLDDARLRITDVADRAGFNSISQFNRVFRRHTGASPTDFRAALRHAASVN